MLKRDEQFEQYLSEPADPFSFVSFPDPSTIKPSVTSIDRPLCGPASATGPVFLPSVAPDRPDPGGSTRPAGSSSVHTEQTSGCGDPDSDYRRFKFSGLKSQADHARAVMAEVERRGGAKMLERFGYCCCDAWFVRHCETGEIRVASKKCGLRWCPVCGQNKRWVITQAVAAWVKTCERPRFMTFTLKHSDDSLIDQILRLYSCFRKIRKWPYFRKKVTGGIWFFQVKKSKTDGRWHPHIHVLVDGLYFPHEILKNMWLTITGDSDIVDIRPVKDPEKAAKEVARYAAAPCRLIDFSIDDSFEIVMAMHGRRIAGTFGTAKGVSLKPKKPEDWYKWEKSYSWKYVIEHRKEDPIFSEIYFAWISGTPSDHITPWTVPKPAEIVEALETEPEKYKQFDLF